MAVREKTANVFQRGLIMASSQFSSRENTDKMVQSSYVHNFSLVIYLNSLPFITIFSVTGLKFPVVCFVLFFFNANEKLNLFGTFLVLHNYHICASLSRSLFLRWVDALSSLL